MSLDAVVMDGKTIRELATESGVPLTTVSIRLGRGWTAERAATTPVRGYTRRERAAEPEAEETVSETLADA